MANFLAERSQQPDLAGLPDWQVAEVLNTPNAAGGTKRTEVATGAARQIMMANGDWIKIQKARANAALPEPVRDCAAEVIEALTPTFGGADSSINMASPTIYGRVQAGLDLLVSLNIISAGTRSEVLALADQPISWAEANGILVTARAVGLARGGR